MSKDNEPTREGADKIRAFDRADQRIEQLKRELVSTRIELEQASDEVVAWLAPSDARLNETFSIAYLDTFLNVKVVGENKFEVTWRNGKRPRRL